MMLQGMTVEYLLRRTYPLRSGETILFHAAAGGVGLIACQWARHLGATVIGTVGSDEKAELARAHGCDHPDRLYTGELYRSGQGADGRGGGSGRLRCGGARHVRGQPRLPSSPGMLVSFGQSSGKIDPFDIGILSAKGSLYLTRPTLMTYTASRADLEASARALFDVVAGGAVRITVNQTFPLAEAADAHRALESRRTTGSTILTP